MISLYLVMPVGISGVKNKAYVGKKKASALKLKP